MLRAVLFGLLARCRAARRWCFNRSLLLDLRTFCDDPFYEDRFIERQRLSPAGPGTGVVLTVDAATDTRTHRRVVMKASPPYATGHMTGDLLPTLLNVSGDHVLVADSCFRRNTSIRSVRTEGEQRTGVPRAAPRPRGPLRRNPTVAEREASDRIASYELMDGSLPQLIEATNVSDPIRAFLPPPNDRACFALHAMHQMLLGLEVAHAVGIVNQDLHAGNLLFKREGAAVRWKVSDYGRAAIVGARRCAEAGTAAIAPEAGHVPLTPASDVFSAALVFLFLRCDKKLDVRHNRGVYKEFLMRLNQQYGGTAGALKDAAIAARRAEARAAIAARRATARRADLNLVPFFTNDLVRAAVALEKSSVPLAAWNTSSFVGVFAAAFPAEAGRCALLAEPTTRESALLASMLDLHWDRRPDSAWLAPEFGHMVRKQCPRGGQ